MSYQPDNEAPAGTGSAGETFAAFLKLGLTSFGGPAAHIGYFRAEFVARRRWLDEAAFAELVALAQFLPGPSSSQTGFGIGLLRAGFPGAAAAWAGFTLPSAVLMLAAAFGLGALADRPAGAALLHGLKLAAVAVVAQAVLGMARTLCPDARRATIAIGAMAVLELLPGGLGQIAAIAVGAIAGLFFCAQSGAPAGAGLSAPVSVRIGVACLALFFALLALAFAPAGATPAALFSAFYRSGALVFGGGHVLLPLLRDAVAAPGWVTDSVFLAGYGAAQALPGPMFTFAAYLGALATPAPGLAGAVIALTAIFTPGLLALVGVLPFWRALRRHARAHAAIAGVNAAVVGVLAAALYNPVWTGAVLRPVDFVIASAAFVALVAWRAPPLVVVLGCAAAGFLSVVA